MGASESKLDCRLGRVISKQGGTDEPWGQHAAVLHGKEDVSVFSHKAMENPPPAFKAAITLGVARLKVLRHPCILKYLASYEESGTLYVVTEPVVPLSSVLGRLSLEEICVGLYKTVKALSFLHIECGLSHNDLGVRSIYVSETDGGWRLGGLGFSHPLEETTKDLLDATRPFRQKTSITPEETAVAKRGDEDPDVHARDAYAFAALVAEVMETSQAMAQTAEMDDQSAADASEFLASVMRDCAHARPSMRPALETLLEMGFFTRSTMLDILRFLGNITFTPPEEKRAFFSNLAARLRTLRVSIVVSVLLPQLLSHRVLSEPFATEFLPSILTPYTGPPPRPKKSEKWGKQRQLHAKIVADASSKRPTGDDSEHEEGAEDEDADEGTDGDTAVEPSSDAPPVSSSSTEGCTPVLPLREYRESLVPAVVRLFALRDFGVRLLLLDQLPLFLPYTDVEILSESLVPMLIDGLTDARDDMVIATLRALCVVTPFLKGNPVIAELGKRRALFREMAPGSRRPTTDAPRARTSSTGMPSVSREASRSSMGNGSRKGSDRHVASRDGGDSEGEYEASKTSESTKAERERRRLEMQQKRLEREKKLLEKRQNRHVGLASAAPATLHQASVGSVGSASSSGPVSPSVAAAVPGGERRRADSWGNNDGEDWGNGDGDGDGENGWGDTGARSTQPAAATTRPPLEEKVAEGSGDESDYVDNDDGDDGKSTSLNSSRKSGGDAWDDADGGWGGPSKGRLSRSDSAAERTATEETGRASRASSVGGAASSEKGAGATGGMKLKGSLGALAAGKPKGGEEKGPTAAATPKAATPAAAAAAAPQPEKKAPEKKTEAQPPSELDFFADMEPAYAPPVLVEKEKGAAVVLPSYLSGIVGSSHATTTTAPPAPKSHAPPASAVTASATRQAPAVSSAPPTARLSLSAAVPDDVADGWGDDDAGDWPAEDVGGSAAPASAAARSVEVASPVPRSPLLANAISEPRPTLTSALAAASDTAAAGDGWGDDDEEAPAPASGVSKASTARSVDVHAESVGGAVGDGDGWGDEDEVADYKGTATGSRADGPAPAVSASSHPVGHATATLAPAHEELSAKVAAPERSASDGGVKDDLGGWGDDDMDDDGDAVAVKPPTNGTGSVPSRVEEPARHTESVDTAKASVNAPLSTVRTGSLTDDEVNAWGAVDAVKTPNAAAVSHSVASSHASGGETAKKASAKPSRSPAHAKVSKGVGGFDSWGGAEDGKSASPSTRAVAAKEEEEFDSWGETTAKKTTAKPAHTSARVEKSSDDNFDSWDGETVRARAKPAAARTPSVTSQDNDFESWGEAVAPAKKRGGSGASVAPPPAASWDAPADEDDWFASQTANVGKGKGASSSTRGQRTSSVGSGSTPSPAPSTGSSGGPKTPTLSSAGAGSAAKRESPANGSRKTPAKKSTPAKAKAAAKAEEGWGGDDDFVDF